VCVRVCVRTSVEVRWLEIKGELATSAQRNMHTHTLACFDTHTHTRQARILIKVHCFGN